MNKPPIGIIPRHFWLKNRINSCIFAINELHVLEDWEQYRKKVKLLAEELLYCTNEWEKFYNE